MFLTLSAITLVLFAITLAAFRSFEAHRERLGRSWAEQGKTSLEHHNPRSAVPALRAALSYTPDDRSYQLLLAEALAGAGHTEEATNYFLNLWTARPGDGLVNLQLARLARERHDASQAIEYYHAAIFGDWGDQGLVRRRACRLELAQYLVDQHDPGSARAELLLVAANAPDGFDVNLLVGERLAAVGDFNTALASFKRALAADSAGPIALARAGATAFLLGDYSGAKKLLDRAVSAKSSRSGALPPADLTDAAGLAHDADTLADLSLSRDLPPETRASHLLRSSMLAETRLKACLHTQNSTSSRSAGEVPGHGEAAGQGIGAAPALPPALLALQAQWKTSGRELRRRAADANAMAQDSLADLVFATEAATSVAGNTPPCPAVSETDALLLLLARRESAATFPANPLVTAIEARAAYLATGVRS